MNNTENLTAPILVPNPYTGRFVNVQPLFALADGGFDGDFNALASSLNKSFHYFATTPVDDDTRNVMDKLLVISNIYNAFDNMSEFTNTKLKNKA